MSKKSTNPNFIQRDFAPIIPTVRTLIRVSQCISGSTGMIGLYLLLKQNIPYELQQFVYFLMGIFAIIIIGSFEFGLLKFFPVWFKQFLNFWFEKKTNEGSKSKIIRIILFGMLTVLMFPLGGGTVITSMIATPYLGNTVTPTPKVSDLYPRIAKIDSLTALIKASYDKEVTIDEEEKQETVSLEKSKWDNKKDKLIKRKTSLLKLNSIKHTWAKGSAKKISNEKIPTLLSQKSEAIQKIIVDYSSKKDEKFNQLNIELKPYQIMRDTLEKQALREDNKAKNKSEIFGNLIEEFILWSACGATFFTMFLLSILALYEMAHVKNGNGVYTPPPSPRRKKEWWKLWKPTKEDIDPALNYVGESSRNSNNHSCDSTRKKPAKKKNPTSGGNETVVPQRLWKDEQGEESEKPTGLGKILDMKGKAVEAETVEENDEVVEKEIAVEYLNEIKYVSIDDLAKATYMQHKRKYTSAKHSTREVNRVKSEVGIMRLEELGVEVWVDEKDEKKLHYKMKKAKRVG